MPIRVGRGSAGGAPLVIRLVPCWLALACLLLAGCHPDLFAAARQSRQQAALVEMFPDPQAQALAIAAEHGDAREVGRLMREEGVDPDLIFSSPKGRIPLLAWPIITGNPDGLRAMLEAGADPNAKTRYPSDRGERYYPNAMVWAAQQPDPAYLRILLDHGGDPDTRNANDEALLFQDRVTSILEVNLSTVSNRLNQVVKILTVMSTIFLPLTVLTGMWGMNIPLPHFPGGAAVQFWWITGIMLAIIVSMLVFFRRNHWI